VASNKQKVTIGVCHAGNEFGEWIRNPTPYQNFMETTFLHAVNKIEYLNSHGNYIFSNK